MSKSDINPTGDPLQRMSVTIPESLLRSLDQMVAERGFDNRSQAVAELIHDRVAEHQQATGTAVMAGSITLFYDQTKNNLLAQLAELQRQHLAEVISSLHVQLEQNFMMEVILVQGPAQKLKAGPNALNVNGMGPNANTTRRHGTSHQQLRRHDPSRNRPSQRRFRLRKLQRYSTNSSRPAAATSGDPADTTTTTDTQPHPT
jgi:CopG family nickel-responsive transcriptional regulator